MTIGWYTDNELSRRVLEAIPEIEIKHISKFHPHNCEHFFYGILRGCGRAMHNLIDKGIDYHYIDNGYFDALYIDKNNYKDMSGKFRVVKSAMHEVYPHAPSKFVQGNRVLIIPPSPYSANFYDTTPEDWIAETARKLKYSGYEIKIRYKSEVTPLENDIRWCDGVFSFNSMSVMRAIEAGKFVIDTHGMLRNYHLLEKHPGYDIKDLRAFYEPRQFTLEEFKQGKWQWN